MSAVSKDDTLQRLAAFNAQLVVEAQQAADAARWRMLIEFAEADGEIMDLVDEAVQIIAFRSQVPFGVIAMAGQAPSEMIDLAIAAKEQ